MPHQEIPPDEQQSGSGSSISSNSPVRLNLRPLLQNRQESISTSSSLGSLPEIPNFQQNNRFPAEPHYLPIVFPREPTLDELLRQVTRRDDLENVESVKLRVLSHMMSLQRIPFFMPKLSYLNLDGSALSSLRDLGCSFEYLKFLNVSNCSLKSLDGTNGIPTVETLIADGNSIEDVGPCCNLVALKRLSLKRNHIQSMGLLSFLGLCPHLKELSLEGNPVTNKISYREDLLKHIESLEILDNAIIANLRSENSESLPLSSSSDNTSSLSDDVWPEQEIEFMPSTSNQQQRPASCREVCHISIIDKDGVTGRRPMSADPINIRTSLTSGGPVCGSIVNKVRDRRNKLKSAWGYSSTSSSGSCSSDFTMDRKKFHVQLPEIMVDSELGQIGVEVKKKNDELNSSSTESLIKLAQQWRLESKRKRDESME